MTALHEAPAIAEVAAVGRLRALKHALRRLGWMAIAVSVLTCVVQQAVYLDLFPIALIYAADTLKVTNIKRYHGTGWLLVSYALLAGTAAVSIATRSEWLMVGFAPVNRPVWLAIPHAVIAIWAGILAHRFISIAREESRARLGRCRSCGYDLWESADACSECGRAVDQGVRDRKQIIRALERFGGVPQRSANDED